MIILDTNVLSALMQQTPDPKVVAWLDARPRTSIWTTAITVLEVRLGLQIMPGGKRRTALMQAFESVLGKIGRRVAPFDVAAAQQAGDQRLDRVVGVEHVMEMRLRLVPGLLLGFGKMNVLQRCPLEIFWIMSGLAQRVVVDPLLLGGRCGREVVSPSPGLSQGFLRLRGDPKR